MRTHILCHLPHSQTIAPLPIHSYRWCFLRLCTMSPRHILIGWTLFPRWSHTATKPHPLQQAVPSIPFCIARLGIANSFPYQSFLHIHWGHLHRLRRYLHWHAADQTLTRKDTDTSPLHRQKHFTDFPLFPHLHITQQASFASYVYRPVRHPLHVHCPTPLYSWLSRHRLGYGCHTHFTTFLWQEESPCLSPFWTKP